MRRGAASCALRALALTLVTLWSGFPILFLLVSSFKPPRDILAFPPSVLFAPTLDNYRALIARWPEFFDALLNSLIITIGATLLTVVVTTLAGYVYSRVRNRATALSAFFMILIRMVPPIVITLPLFPVVNMLGLNDTHLVLIVLYATFFVSLNTWIMKAFMDQIPREMDESAAIDGGTLLQTLRYVIMPLAPQGMIAASTFVLIFSWNEFLFAFIFTTTEARTAPLIISEMIGAIDGVDWGVLFAAASLQLLPILIFVIAVQKYVVAGLAAGSLKG
ncbi:MAG: carbohydrate ABC transporter permease [Alphaproteobacteria bacterium]|nr:carbohydrate ABC transporter permease [Alphaproteobacteria bacterium]